MIAEISSMNRTKRLFLIKITPLMRLKVHIVNFRINKTKVESVQLEKTLECIWFKFFFSLNIFVIKTRIESDQPW